MNPTRKELLFGLALTKSASERIAFLERECAGDPALRQRLEALLAANEEPDTLLATPPDPRLNSISRKPRSQDCQRVSPRNVTYSLTRSDYSLGFQVDGQADTD